MLWGYVYPLGAFIAQSVEHSAVIYGVCPYNDTERSTVRPRLKAYFVVVVLFEQQQMMTMYFCGGGVMVG